MSYTQGCAQVVHKVIHELRTGLRTGYAQVVGVGGRVRVRLG